VLDAAEVARKAKRRKYMDEPCDMSVGWHEDSSGHPAIDMCPSRHVRFFPELGHFGVYLCDEHFEKRLGEVVE
jgi:hypothetical protein